MMSVYVPTFYMNRYNTVIYTQQYQLYLFVKEKKNRCWGIQEEINEKNKKQYSSSCIPKTTTTTIHFFFWSNKTTIRDMSLRFHFSLASFLLKYLSCFVVYIVCGAESHFSCIFYMDFERFLFLLLLPLLLLSFMHDRKKKQDKELWSM